VSEFVLTRSRYRLEEFTSRRTEIFRALFISEISYVLSDRSSRKIGSRSGKSLVREKVKCLEMRRRNLNEQWERRSSTGQDGPRGGGGCRNIAVLKVKK
jgi:hypothetical protein